MRLSIKGVAKSFPGVQALENVTMDFAPGEIQALMGENGAGKSTLIKIITGVHRPDAGTMELGGRAVAFASPRAALAAGVGAVHQERNLIPRFSVGENVLLEHPPLEHGLVDREAINRRAQTVLNLLDPSIDARTEVRRLSVAQMQLVEIAKALSLDARVLLLDEPTASITDHEAAALFQVLRRLRADGVTLVYVSHKLDEVMALCDRVSVLRDGRTAASGVPMSEMTRRRLVSLMIGREEPPAGIPASRSLGETVLQLRKVSTSSKHEDIDLTLRKGEILGLYGLVGAGRTELARAIIGIEKITGGELLVRGRRANIRDPREALMRHRMGYVSEDRKFEGLILEHSVIENVAITIWRRIASWLGIVAPAREASVAAQYVEALSIRTASPRQKVGLLSGGNQQKVSIAKWLAAETDILIVDEPTVGIDVKTKAELHGLIGGLAQRGVAVLLISSDMAEIIALADRITILHGFRAVGDIANNRRYDETSQAIMARIHAAETSEAANG
jgi:ribose transport system ATP-binding protein